jgi:hypothetical protein
MHHHIARKVRRYWWLPGRNSRKVALSTGMLPPTPKPARAKRVASAAKDGAAPAERPKIPVMRRVRLNDHLHKKGTM